MFGVPPHKLYELARSTNNNIEHQAIEFVTDSVFAWVKRWEGAVDISCIGRDRMLQGVYSKFNLDTLLRGDSTQRAAFYKSMRDVGAYSPNEIRALEDRDPIEGGDIHLVPMNMVPLTSAEELLDGKTNASSPEKGSPPGG